MTRTGKIVILVVVGAMLLAFLCCCCSGLFLFAAGSHGGANGTQFRLNPPRLWQGNPGVRLWLRPFLRLR
jgi:hypothetical protein